MRPLPPLFGELNDVDVYTALRRFVERDVQPGDVLIAEDAPGPGLICVQTGSLEIRRDGVVVGTAKAGDLVGEMALFEGAHAATATVAAAEPSHILTLDRAGYEALRDVLHPLAQVLEVHALGLLGDRVRRVGDRIAKLAKGGSPDPRRPGEWFTSAIAKLFGKGGVFSTDVVDPLGALTRSPIFSDAPEDALKPIGAALWTRSWGAGHVLCTEGETGDRMYLLDEGEVDVVVTVEGQQIQHLVTLTPGAAFGMVALVLGSPRMSSCVARTTVVVHVLDRDGWDRLKCDQGITGTAFRRAMIRVLSEQLAWSNAQLAEFEAQRADPSALGRAQAGLEAHGAHLRAS